MRKVSVTMWFGTEKALDSTLFMDALVMYTYVTALDTLVDKQNTFRNTNYQFMQYRVLASIVEMD